MVLRKLEIKFRSGLERFYGRSRCLVVGLGWEDGEGVWLGVFIFGYG